MDASGANVKLLEPNEAWNALMQGRPLRTLGFAEVRIQMDTVFNFRDAKNEHCGD